jgi:hypothetical protein
MKRVATLVAVSLVAAACGQSSTTATTATTTTTTVDPPWTTVPVPTTPPFEIVLENGETLEVEAVCVGVEAEGVVSQPWAEEDVGLALSVLGLEAEPGEPCEATFRLWASATRDCATYSGLGTCCTGYSIETIVRIEVHGEALDVLRHEHSQPTLFSTTSGNCPGKNTPMRIGSSIEEAFGQWFGLVSVRAGDPALGQQPTFREDVFWRLVAALHHADVDVVDQAGKYMRDWAEAWEADGSPSDGIPFTQAVPHLVSSLDAGGHYPGAREEALEKITQQTFTNAADWWEWWEGTSES